MSFEKYLPSQFERFVDSLANEVISGDKQKITLLIGKNGTGKSFVLSEILKRSVQDGVTTLATSFGLSDRFPFSREGAYVYIGARSSANAIHINSIDSKIFDAIVAKWSDDCFRQRLKQICELLELPVDFKARIVLRQKNEGIELTDFLMDSWVRRTGAGRAAWPLLTATNFYSDEQRKRFAAELGRKFKLSVSDVESGFAILQSIALFDKAIDGKNRQWLRGVVPIAAIAEIGEVEKIIPALRFMGIVGEFSLSIGGEGGSAWLSSGQKSILFTLVQISRYITTNALILIDEPEISLHPEWQSKYLSFLQQIFGDVPCKIVLATHSPFFVVSTAAETALVYSLRRTDKGHEWQCIETLSGLTVDVAAVDGFGVRYPSSPHLEQLLFTAIEELGKPAPNLKTIATLYKRLAPLVRDPSDPLRVVVDKLEQFKMVL